MGEDVVYIKAPDWWPEPIPEGHCLQLLKSIYGTRQAARRWHIHISDWMEKNGYPAVNSEKTIFMKREGEHFIIHGLFVDDMMHTTTSTKLKDEFLRKYSKDFNITGGGLMKTFLGMEVEQDNKTIKLHLDHYVQETLAEYKDYIKKSLRPKRVPISLGFFFVQICSSRSTTGHSRPRFSLRHLEFASISRLWYRSLRGFVLPQAQLTGQHSTI